MTENEEYVEVERDEFRAYCVSLCAERAVMLRLMFAVDERATDNCFKVYAVFSGQNKDTFYIPFFKIKEDDPKYQSITDCVPAAHWYEREIRDMFGLIPEGHPDPRRLVFHESFPADSHPLRKDWKISETDLKEWGEGVVKKVPHDFLKVEGKGICEIPVGPVHAGIIEPGHFRFSAVGETIINLEPRLFYTHKGTEKLFESMSFLDGIKLAERVSGASSFSHSIAYSMAVERMAGIKTIEKIKAIRTFLLELERLYNHIGDIGYMCAGTALMVGQAKGALIKEKLLQLNEKLTGSRFLRGINKIGGVTKDVFLQKFEISETIDMVEEEFKDLLKLLLGQAIHVERLTGTGRLPKEIAAKLGVTGVAARASGLSDDIRKSHPHLFYYKLDLKTYTRTESDALARMMLRADEVECSLSLIRALVRRRYYGNICVDVGEIPPDSFALGYTESPRGSLFYWVKSDQDGKPFRVKLRSPSYCNWPAVPYAIPGNIVPDFPLCNKSFNLSYSGCDM